MFNDVLCVMFSHPPMATPIAVCWFVLFFVIIISLQLFARDDADGNDKEQNLEGGGG